MSLASKGSALGLSAVCLYQFKEKKTCAFSELQVMGIEKIGGRRTEAEPKSHINCLELMHGCNFWFQSFL